MGTLFTRWENKSHLRGSSFAADTCSDAVDAVFGFGLVFLNSHVKIHSSLAAKVVEILVVVFSAVENKSSFISLHAMPKILAASSNNSAGGAELLSRLSRARCADCGAVEFIAPLIQIISAARYHHLHCFVE